MLHAAHLGADPIEDALAWIERRGIAVVAWDGIDAVPLTHAQPALYLVAPDAPPPHHGPFEDWVRLPLDREELVARADLILERLRRFRPVPVELDEGVLMVGSARVILSLTEAKVVAVLLDHPGQVVARSHIAAAVWPGQPDAEAWLGKHLRSLRRRTEGLPIEVHTVRGRGVLLEVLPPGAEEANRAQ